MEDFVVTRGAALRGVNAAKDFVTVSYTARKKKQRSIEVSHGEPTTESNVLTGEEARREQEKQMKRARFDVIKFGMSGFDGAKGEAAKVNLAIKLGAKPAKRKGINYKELKAEREKSKARATRREQGLNGVKQQRGGDKKRRRKQPGLLGSYGVVKKATVAAITDNKRRF